MVEHDPATVELVASVLRSYVGSRDWTPHAGRAVLDALAAAGWRPFHRVVGYHVPGIGIMSPHDVMVVWSEVRGTTAEGDSSSHPGAQGAEHPPALPEVPHGRL